MAQINVNAMNEEKEMKRNERALNTGAANPQGTLKDAAVKSAQNSFAANMAKAGSANGSQTWDGLLKSATGNGLSNGLVNNMQGNLQGGAFAPTVTNFSSSASSITPTNPAGGPMDSGTEESSKGLNLTSEQWAMISNPAEQDPVVKDSGASVIPTNSAMTESEKQTVAGLNEYVKTNGLVAVRDYVTSRGIPADIKWNGETGEVSINGISFKPTAIVDGKAYMPQSQLDAILAEADKQTGIKRDSDILAEAQTKYGGRVDEAFSKYMDYGDFSYSAKNDRAFQEFMDAYKKGVQEEYNTNMAQARFRTGGVPSSAVMQQAANIRESALDDSAKYRQQFEDRAYQKWQDGYANAYNELMAANGMMNDYYSLNSKANANTADAFYKSKDFDVQNRLDWNKLWRDSVDTGLYEGVAKDEAKMTENDRRASDVDADVYEKYGMKMALSELIRSDLSNAELYGNVKVLAKKYGVSEDAIWAKLTELSERE